MEKKKQDPEIRELKDPPVPPVKGAVTERPDVLLRPLDGMTGVRRIPMEQVMALDGWL